MLRMRLGQLCSAACWIVIHGQKVTSQERRVEVLAPSPAGDNHITGGAVQFRLGGRDQVRKGFESLSCESGFSAHWYG